MSPNVIKHAILSRPLSLSHNIKDERQWAHVKLSIFYENPEGGELEIFDQTMQISSNSAMVMMVARTDGSDGSASQQAEWLLLSLPLSVRILGIICNNDPHSASHHRY